MEKELIEKLRSIAQKYEKISSLDVCVKNGNGMCLDEENRTLKFEHTLDIGGAEKIAAEIIAAMSEFGYAVDHFSREQCTPIVWEYTINY